MGALVTGVVIVAEPMKSEKAVLRCHCVRLLLRDCSIYCTVPGCGSAQLWLIRQQDGRYAASGSDFLMGMPPIPGKCGWSTVVVTG